MNKKTTPHLELRSKKTYIRPQQKMVKIRLRSFVAISERVKAIKNDDDGFEMAEDGYLYKYDWDR